MSQRRAENFPFTWSYNTSTVSNTYCMIIGRDTAPHVEPACFFRFQYPILTFNGVVARWASSPRISKPVRLLLHLSTASSKLD